MEEVDKELKRFEVKAQEDFNQCLNAYRSMDTTGKTVVTDMRRVPEGLQKTRVVVVEEEEEEEEDEAEEEWEAEAEAEAEQKEWEAEAEQKKWEVETEQKEWGDEAEQECEDEDEDEDEEEEEEEEEEDEEDAVLSSKNLAQGSHMMGPTNLNCLIYKVDKPDQKVYTAFCLLKNVRHPAIATHQTFYEESGQPRVALSWMNFKLKDFAISNEGSQLFFRTTNSGCDLNPWFRSAILDLCNGLSHVLDHLVYPVKIKLDDLYVFKDGQGKYHLKLLIVEAEEIKGYTYIGNRCAELWKHLRMIIRKIKSITSGKAPALGGFAKRFINYIGNDVKMLSQYPDIWSYKEKGSYLLSIIAADANSVRRKLTTSRLKKWPKDKRTNKIPKLLLELIKDDDTSVHPQGYSTKEPYDYLLLCRDTYKHFKTLCEKVALLKDMCKNCEAFLMRMEKWQPLIWCILFDAMGRP